MARRIMLTVSYDGTRYCGWQLQKNGRTIEQVLNEAIRELTGQQVQVTGASRTDAGVHATGNVAVFDTDTRIPPEKLAFALNARLPEDVRIQASEEVATGFHPRKVNSIKTYEYRIWNDRFENPLRRLYTHFVYLPLDVSRMREAAGYLVGEHDFKSFAAAGNQTEETIRTIYSAQVFSEGKEILIRLRGNGFLYHMVRIIAGTLIQAGAGSFAPAHIREILEARDRRAACQTAPARGLTLAGITYRPELEDCLTVRQARWIYGIWQREIAVCKEAFLCLFHCVEEDFRRNVVRLVKKSVRDGAERVWVCDRAGRPLEDCPGEYRITSVLPAGTIPKRLPLAAFTAAFPELEQMAGCRWACVEQNRMDPETEMPETGPAADGSAGMIG